MDTDNPSNGAISIVDQLKAWNRAWNSSSNKNSNAVADVTNTGTDSATKADGTARDKDKQQGQQQQQQHKEAIPPTLLEKARLALSKKNSTKTTPVFDDSKGCSNNGNNNNNNPNDLVVRDSIVPHLFSVLQTKDYDNAGEAIDGKKDAAGLSSPLPSPSPKGTPADSERDATNGYELRQMEWHVVLLLELWARGTTPSNDYNNNNNNDNNRSKAMILDAIVTSIGLHRKLQSQRTDKNNRKKNRKKKKKDKKKRTDPKALLQESSATTAASSMSEKDKEALLLDHLVRILSRAPFLLPRDVPLSDFLIHRCLTPERTHWERLPFVVSHIFETFDIPNPYLPKSRDDDDNDNDGIAGGNLFSSSSTVDKTIKTNGDDDNNNNNNNNANLSSKAQSSYLSAGSSKKKPKNAVDGTIFLARKRKLARERLQELAKNKKRQRLASLTLSKKKHRGSHFHGNLGDISKLLDKKKKKSATTATISSSKQIAVNANKRAILAKPKKQKTSENNSSVVVEYRRPSETSTKPSKDKNANKRTTSIRKHTIKNRTERILDTGNNSENNNSSSNGKIRKIETNRNNRSGRGNNRSGGIDSFSMTPKRSVRYDDATTIVGESPVLAGAGARLLDTVVGESPVPCTRSRTVVGESPVPGSGAGNARVFSSSRRHFSFPPPLSSAIELATTKAEDAAVPSTQPVKLFGTVKLLKRTSSINSTGESRANAGRNPASGAPRRNEGTTQADSSSIDTARAYLRRKSTRHKSL